MVDATINPGPSPRGAIARSSNVGKRRAAGSQAKSAWMLTCQLLF
ncbi:MAG: hypothetical protein AAF220_05500 [Pseudomonadota bacterium]